MLLIRTAWDHQINVSDCYESIRVLLFQPESFCYVLRKKPLLKFLKDSRRALASSDKYVVAYFPVASKLWVSGSISDTVSTHKIKGCPKWDTMKALHEPVEHSLQFLAKDAIAALPATAQNGFRMQLQLLLSSYVAAIPEAENTLSFELGYQPVVLC